MYKKLSDDERRVLLEFVERMNPDADDSRESIRHVFLPLPEYRRVLDDHVVLVLGDRGVGKSALFLFLQSEARRVLEPTGKPHDWIVGFSESGIEHPAPLALEQIVAERDTAEVAARAFWLGHLLGRVAHTVASEVPPPSSWQAWNAAPTNPKTWIGAFIDPTEVLLWLDRVDHELEQRQRVVVVTYDHLDRIGVRNREARRRLLPPLLALWLSFSNRYRFLRTKIFLRQDLFRESVPQTSDASKLQARAATIRWTTPALYRLLLRHMAESGKELRSWLQSGVKGIQLIEDEGLGWMPPMDLPEKGKISQQTFMEHLVGKAMGDTTDPRAGYPHKWVPARLADANGAIAPRSMITLFRSAAEHALKEGPKADHLRLLTPDEMKEGLRETSDRRVSELAEEHPVVERLRHLAHDKLPLSVMDASSRLARPRPDDPDGFGDSGERVLEELARLGVVAPAGKDRIDVPDIYRLHFGIRRAGQKVAVGARVAAR
jgi:hypothetical protein